METWVALLRAVNVGGTGKLPMSELRRVCAEAGFQDVATQGASGNAVFRTAEAEEAVQACLSMGLAKVMGAPAVVILRRGEEIGTLLAALPFPASADPAVCHVFFLPGPPPADALSAVRGQADEVLWFGPREIFVHYPSGAGRSKLRVPAAAAGTARNLNTVRKLAEMAGGLA